MSRGLQAVGQLHQSLVLMGVMGGIDQAVGFDGVVGLLLLVAA